MPAVASDVRLWTAARVQHPDAPLIANELYVALLGTGSPVIEMTISTAGSRVRFTAQGDHPLSVLQRHGPGRQIVAALAHLAGVTTDEMGMWAQLGHHTADWDDEESS
ncbi:hypothetical protein [Streptomyces sp. enrichment culture]|uniref:hypothetical protein n=1 Tax=Streptomyces sp. enrichment culture TaxID=1795815 RepID=UPI003F57D29E